MITDVLVYPLLYTPNERYGDANGIKPYRATVLLQIKHSSGLAGWGECTGPLPMIVYEAQALQQRLYKKDVWNRTDIMRSLRDATPRIQAAVDIALWDLIGKLHNQPIHAVLGGAYREHVPLYASMQSYAETQPQTKWLLHLLQQVPDRFEMIKMKIGALPLAYDCQLIELAAETLPESIAIAVDANQSYDESLARTMVAFLQNINNESNRNAQIKGNISRIQWFEEPMPLTQTESYKAIRQNSSISIAGGENLPDARSCIDFASHQTIDILQPDILHIGGISQLHFLYQYAAHMKLRCSPHTFDGGLARIATIHVASVAKPYTKANLAWEIDPIEWDIMENPFTTLFDCPLQISNGTIAIPKGPGLGVEVDLSTIEKYAWEPTKTLSTVQPVPTTMV